MPNGIFALAKNRVLGTILGFGAGAAASSAFEPPMRDVVAELNSEFDNVRLLPSELAETVVRGVRSQDAAASEAKESGLNSSRFAELVRITGNPPGVEQLLELWARGVIPEGRVEEGIRQGRIRTEWTDSLKALKRQLISANALAEMVVQGVLPLEAATAGAARVGVEAADFERMVRLSGNPIAPEEALALWNRGEISESDVNRALVQSRLKPEWVDNFKKLRRVIPSLSDMVRFAVREVWTPEVRQRFGLDDDFPARFASEAAKHGFSSEDAHNEWAAHWDLPSIEQGFGMLHRGIIDQETLKLLLRTQDVMPFWRERLIKLAYLVPGRIDLRRMFKAGTIDRAEVLRGYLNLGYSQLDAERLTSFAQDEKLQAEKDLSKGEIVASYQAQEIPRSDAAAALAKLGFDQHESELILGIADYQAARSYRNAVISVVHSRFKDREIDAAEATTRLDTIGVQPDAREKLLDLWTFERAQNPRHLTEAEFRKVWKKGLATVDQYKDHLRILGFPDSEIDLWVAVNS